MALFLSRPYFATIPCDTTARSPIAKEPFLSPSLTLVAYHQIICGNDTMALGAQAAVLAAGGKDIIVVGFDGSDDAIQSILKGELKATALQPVAEMANQAAIQADQYIKTGKTDKPEKQSIDMVLLTPENACQYKTFAPTGSTESCLGVTPEATMSATMAATATK